MLKKRSLIQLSPSSLVVSLPKAWLKTLHLKKGDLVDVVVDGNYVVVSPSFDFSSLKKVVDVSNLSKHMIELLILSSYKSGCSELVLNYSKLLCSDLKIKKQVSIPSVVREVVGNLIGFEVVKQTKFSSIIKEVASSESSEFENLLRRTFLLILDSSIALKESLYGGGDSSTLIHEFKTANRLINYCLRLLKQKAHLDCGKTLSMFSLLYTLSGIVETYNFIFLFSKNCRSSQKLFHVFEDSTNIFRQAYEFYYKPNTNALNRYYSLRRRLYSFINNLRFDRYLRRCDVSVLDYLAVVVNSTFKIVELRLSMD